MSERAGAIIMGPHTDSLWRQGLAWIGYPLAFVVAGLCASVLLDRNTGLWLSAFGAATAGIAMVLCLEALLPYRGSWVPRGADLPTDAFYLAAVQFALPQALSLGLLSALAGSPVAASVPVPWPHDWPLPAQALLILVAGELAHYGLHRGLHRIGVLWRFHALHHRPLRLYALNVARFHPLERGVQWLLETAPFILIGVAPEAVAIAYVFYAVNGYFQHANCAVRLGWLNWIVAGPELHRWHHAIDAPAGAVNFGNNLIVWDIVFGTRHLPRRSVGALGTGEADEPRGLLGQWLAPFRGAVR